VQARSPTTLVEAGKKSLYLSLFVIAYLTNGCCLKKRPSLAYSREREQAGVFACSASLSKRSFYGTRKTHENGLCRNSGKTAHFYFPVDELKKLGFTDKHRER
jgi:hypothetical protein